MLSINLLQCSAKDPRLIFRAPTLCRRKTDLAVAGDALRATIRKHEPVRKHKELGRAWLSLVSFIIDNLKQGQDSSRSAANPGAVTTPGGE
jgi:hypothetical protein